jgi:OmpA-OmpF porin, OOP family
MRKYLLAAASALAFASPAAALDNSWYVGVEGGAMVVEDTEFDYRTTTSAIDDAIIVDNKIGIDLDLIGGYDFGWVRAEAELAYKRASVDEANVNQGLTAPAVGGFRDADGRTSVLSAMVNVLLDFGDDEGWAGYVGGGAGLARVKYKVDVNGLTPALGFSDSDDSFAWQAIAGVRKAISDNMEIGLKYRFFNASNLNYSGTRGGTTPVAFDLETRYRSHSLLASLIFNFAPPPPPPPEPERG